MPLVPCGRVQQRAPRPPGRAQRGRYGPRDSAAHHRHALHHTADGPAVPLGPPAHPAGDEGAQPSGS
eukprot:scaffold158_cov126-Isochrysis_galbana.AAC.6